MEEINETLQQLADLATSIERQVAQLKDDAGAYADEAAHARRRGDKVQSFGGSDAQKQLNAISVKLKVASQAVAFVGTELVRFS